MKKANPKTVGGFVVGAVILSLVAVGVFGTGRFFEERQTLVAFFPGSLQGLRVGAPVQMRGIVIGKVTDLWVEYNESTLEFTIPVIMDIELSRIRGEDPEHDQGDALIALGLRAQLVAQSLVTGQKTIQFDFHPDTPVNMVETDLPYTQVPTIPSAFSKLQSSIDEVADRAGVVLAEISDLLSQENRALVHKTLVNLSSLTGELDERAKKLDPVIDDLGDLIAAVRANEPNFQKDLKQLLTTGTDTLVAYEALAKRADKLIADNQKGIGEFANTGLYEITNLAVDLQATAEQIRRVMEEMERDPARFFLGRPREVQVE